MRSKAVSPAPKDPERFMRWVEQHLRDHAEDIRDLYEMTTDCDLQEEQIENVG